MKVIKICIFVTFMTLSVSLMAENYFPALFNGYPADQLDPVRDKAIAIAHIDQATGLKPLSAITITNFGSGDIYYALFSNIQIRAFNLAENTYLGGWSIKRTSDDSQDKIAGLSASNGRDEAGTEYDMQIGSDNVPGLGCLRDIPLRYGDVTGDGKPELVLLLGNNDTGQGYADTRLDFVVFSLQSHTVIFSARLGREATGGPIADFDPAYKQKPNYAALPQTIDVNGADEGAAGMRYYAKLYFGDFDGNGKPDIIAWRKRYDSRLVNDPVQGYKLTAELLTLYELDNGVYKAQSTDETTIKGWLAAKSLTWQKGYPQTSECAGQTGQPIPEMVDPLLNDPDVLK